MPRLQRILETALYVDDLDRASRFYAGVIGLESLLISERLHAYDAGGGTVLLLFRRGASLQDVETPAGRIVGHDGAGPVHMAFAITSDALPEWEAHLTAHGIAIEGRMRWQAGGISLYFRDPDGHVLELATPGLWRTW